MRCPVVTFKDHFAFAIIATDRENDKLHYSISGPNAVFFNVDSETGSVTIRSRLDREV